MIYVIELSFCRKFLLCSRQQQETIHRLQQMKANSGFICGVKQSGKNIEMFSPRKVPENLGLLHACIFSCI
jgi:hypothetical protein